MAENELIGIIFISIMCIGIYGLIGVAVGMLIDITSDHVMWSCVFLWPVILPIYVIRCFVKTIRDIWR